MTRASLIERAAWITRDTIKKERKETVAVRCQAPYKAKMPKKRPPSQQPKETCAHRWVRQSTLSSCLSLLLLPQHIMRCAIARQSPTELNLKWRIKIPESFLQTTWAGTFWASRQTQRQWDVQWEGLWDVQWRQAADSGSDKCSTQCSAPCDENSSTVRIALYIEIVKNHRVLGAVSGAWLGLMAKRDERRQREVARCQRKRRRWRLPRRVKANFRCRRLLSHVFHYTLHTVLPSLSLSPLSFSPLSPIFFYRSIHNCLPCPRYIAYWWHTADRARLVDDESVGGISFYIFFSVSLDFLLLLHLPHSPSFCCCFLCI